MRLCDNCRTPFHRHGRAKYCDDVCKREYYQRRNLTDYAVRTLRLLNADTYRDMYSNVILEGWRDARRPLVDYCPDKGYRLTSAGVAALNRAL